MKAIAVLIVVTTLAGPAAAAERSTAWVETVVGACVGGAAIGAVVAYAGAAPAVASTAGYFCGLSVVATLSAQTAISTWRRAMAVIGW